jgi:hypothetical protein
VVVIRFDRDPCGAAGQESAGAMLFFRWSQRLEPRFRCIDSPKKKPTRSDGYSPGDVRLGRRTRRQLEASSWVAYTTQPHRVGKRTAEATAKAGYRTPYFHVLVFGVLCMWLAWLGGTALILAGLACSFRGSFHGISGNAADALRVWRN